VIEWTGEVKYNVSISLKQTDGWGYNIIQTYQ